MPDQLDVPRTDDPLAHLRASVAAHAAVAAASKQAGAELRAGQPTQPDERQAQQ